MTAEELEQALGSLSYWSGEEGAQNATNGDSHNAYSKRCVRIKEIIAGFATLESELKHLRDGLPKTYDGETITTQGHFPENRLYHRHPETGHPL